MITVPVELGERAYEVVVGEGARHLLAGVVGRTVPKAVRAGVVTQENIAVTVDPGIRYKVFTVPDGETAKSMTGVETLCRGFAACGLSRGDVVVAVGGGVVTDLAGFAAASFHRGVSVVNVATSLLGQVDAAIGGKTGVNLPEGKNLVGAFWQPRGVLCDTEVLRTLPPREWASGRGEMAKYMLLAGATPRHGAGSLALLDLSLDEQVAHCVGVKAAVVAGDERDGSGRMVLNYGHTLAHALEGAAFGGGQVDGLRHGEAVAVGLHFAALLARRLGRIDDQRVVIHRQVLEALDLPFVLPPGSDPERLVEFMARDKKAHHDLTFVLDGPDGVSAVGGVGRDEVLITLNEMEAQP